MARVLVVDDEAGVRFTLEEILTDAGHAVVAASGVEEARAHLEGADVVLTDLVMPGGSGLELLALAQEEAPSTPVILLTARGSERAAVEALRRGAWDYLTKPFELDELVASVGRASEASALRRAARDRAAVEAVGHAVVAESGAMRRLLAAVERVARRDVTVLVRGETGVGKEVIGSLIHGWSPRATGPLVRFNCAAIAESLAEAELFGVERGAYTGAHQARAGFFQRAQGGTLVLDEVGELPLALQAKLLRALQEGEVQPVGGSRVAKVDVRVVACTNRALAGEVEQGRFRADLYYRLAVVELEVPPLRERRDDIAPLIERFRRRYGERFGLEGVVITPAAVAALRARPWPGNVRELENAVARAMALSAAELLDVDAFSAAPLGAAPATSPEGLLYSARFQAFEQGLLREALERAAGNRSEAARLLGLSRTTLLDKLKRYDMA